MPEDPRGEKRPADAIGRAVIVAEIEDERMLRRDRQVILTEDLDDQTLVAIRTAEPGERSRAAGRRVADSATG